jgi:ribosome biogenesis protein MAK21
MHINTLFKLTHESTFNISLQAMLLIHSLLAAALPTVSPSRDNKAGSEFTTESNMQSRFLRTIYTSLHDPRLRASSKKSLYLNLLLKVMNHPYHSSSALTAKNQELEAQVRRSFWRRLASVAVAGTGMAGENEVVCGSMFVLGEVSSRVSDLKNIGKEFPKEQTARRRDSGKKNPVDNSSQEHEDEYDPRKREPEFARADLTPIWELTTLANHYHPSVALHAQQLLDGRPVTANADLSLNTLSHFLDR